jgi:hypothetical protein
MKKISRTTFIALLGISLMISACGEEKAKEEKSTPDPKPIPKPDVDETPELQGKIFSFPSPIEIASILGKTDASYNNALLNPADRENEYITNYKSALNLGIYGADLGYSVLFEDQNLANSYLKSIRNITEKLSINNALSSHFLGRIEQNLTNTDSLLVLVGECYMGIYDYLSYNDRLNIVSLMEAGTWIEAIYITSQLNESGSNEALVKLIAEQKNSLSNLITMLRENTQDEPAETKSLLQGLTELEEAYKNVEDNYKYVLPYTDADKKLTEIKSTTNYEISDDDLAMITEKLKFIRNKIVE